MFVFEVVDQGCTQTDMEFVKNITRPDFQVEKFTPSISPNFNFNKKKTQKNE